MSIYKIYIDIHLRNYEKVNTLKFIIEFDVDLSVFLYA